jgi:hypothetical protein
MVEEVDITRHQGEVNQCFRVRLVFVAVQSSLSCQFFSSTCHFVKNIKKCCAEIECWWYELLPATMALFGGVQYLMGEDLKVVWVKFLTLS